MVRGNPGYGGPSWAELATASCPASSSPKLGERRLGAALGTDTVGCSKRIPPARTAPDQVPQDNAAREEQPDGRSERDSRRSCSGSAVRAQLPEQGSEALAKA